MDPLDFIRNQFAEKDVPSTAPPSSSPTAPSPPLAHQDSPRTPKGEACSICDLGSTRSEPSRLQSVYVGPNELHVIPFTDRGVRVKIHFLNEAEYRGYIPCNGDVCDACRVGYSAMDWILLPVYNPDAAAVQVLQLSIAKRPGALLPQLAPLINSGQPLLAMLQQRPDKTYSVNSMPLTHGDDAGESSIVDFLAKMNAGQVDLASVLNHLSNEDLRAIPAIAAKLKRKGFI